MGGPTDVKGGDVPPSTAFGILSNGRRRAVLDHLRRTGPSDVDDLTAVAVSREDGAPAAESVRVSLVHRHLPKLADAGLARRDGGAVVPTDRLDALDPYFALLE